MVANFGGFRPVGPGGFFPCGTLQTADLPFQFFIFREFKGVLPLLVFVPGGKVAPADFDVGLVDGQNMVNTPIQKGPVMGYQNKALFAF